MIIQEWTTFCVLATVNLLFSTLYSCYLWFKHVNKSFGKLTSNIINLNTVFLSYEFSFKIKIFGMEFIIIFKTKYVLIWTFYWLLISSLEKNEKIYVHKLDPKDEQSKWFPESLFSSFCVYLLIHLPASSGWWQPFSPAAHGQPGNASLIWTFPRMAFRHLLWHD